MGKQAMNSSQIQQENQRFQGTGGISQENRCYGFVPAFLDQDTGQTYPARFADGRLAPMHLLEGLPDEVVSRHDGQVDQIKPSLVTGFLRGKRFFTREQTARALRLVSRLQARRDDTANTCG